MTWIDRLEEWTLVILVVIMSVVSFVNVVTRNLSVSLSFTDELTTNLFVFVVFIGASVAARRGAHLSLSLINEVASPRVLIVTILITGLSVLFLFGVIFYQGIEMVRYQMAGSTTTPAMGLPEWWFSLSVPIGSFLCFLRFSQHTWNEYKKVNRREEG